MSAVTRYSHAHVQVCRAELASQLTAYRDLVAAASKASGMSLTRIDAALSAFEPVYFNNLLIALHARFSHFEHDAGQTSGNPLDEVRLLVTSLVVHGGVMTVDGGTRYESGHAVLGIDKGDRIALNAEDFEALSTAFLAKIDATYPG